MKKDGVTTQGERLLSSDACRHTSVVVARQAHRREKKVLEPQQSATCARAVGALVRAA